MTEPKRLFPMDGWDWTVVGVAASQLALAAYIALFGPRRPVALHFDLSGHVDRWGSRLEVTGILVALVGLTLGVGLAARRFVRHGDISYARRKSQNIPRFGLLMAMIPLTLLMSALGMGQMQGGEDQRLNVRLALAVIWVIITVMGSVTGRLAPNRMAGVRTYWSLRSRQAWDKSNRLLGRIYLVGGVFGLLTTAFLEPAPAVSLLLAISIGGGLIATFESWRVWRTDPERRI